MNCNKPVNIKDTKHICREDCSYQYNYSANSSVLVINKGDCLELKIDGKNKVNFNGYTIDLEQSETKDGAVKIFQPSLHLFDGVQVDGEIIITHSGSNNTVLVCVPIIVRDGGGKSNNFFQQLIPHINLAEGNPDPQNVNVSKWSLNDIMPTGDFYFYNGDLPYYPCIKNVQKRINVIVFGVKSAATINKSDYKLLQSLIEPIIYNNNNNLETLKAIASKTPVIMSNKEGEQGGGAIGPNSQSKEFTIFENCEYIDGMEKKEKTKKTDLSGFIIALIVIIGLIILFALAYNYISNRGSNNSSGSANTPST